MSNVFDACAELLNQAELSDVDGVGVHLAPERNDDVDRLAGGTLGKFARRAPLDLNRGL